MKTLVTLFGAALAVAAIPSQASAADLLYSLRSLTAGGYTATWRIAANPLVTQAVWEEGFAIERVSGTLPRTTAGNAYLDFYSAANGGGLMISDADGASILATLYGPQLYTGAETAPTMLTGEFTLTGSQTGGRRYRLNVTNAAAVPEPTCWVLMIGGFGMVGGVMRRRCRVAIRHA